MAIVHITRTKLRSMLVMNGVSDVFGCRSRLSNRCLIRFSNLIA
jgi:hypothetical protein